MTTIDLADGKRIELVQGDLTREATDAIVNAANEELLPGGGVCGAIHRAGGPAIAAECRRIVRERGPLADGEAAMTTGGDLPARFVIHAVGPVWDGGRRGEPEALASCYQQAIRLADEAGLASVAFPAISTGVYGYPTDRAAPVALAAVREALSGTRAVRLVRFVLFDAAALAAFEHAAAAPPAT
jgi:O-acetyl-ADP-ribose deacetylase (regulator of RNase III)